MHKSGYSKLIDTYHIRDKVGDLNINTKVRKDWVTYLDNGMEEECDEQMQKVCYELTIQNMQYGFEEIWLALKN